MTTKEAIDESISDVIDELNSNLTLSSSISPNTISISSTINPNDSYYITTDGSNYVTTSDYFSNNSSKIDELKKDLNGNNDIFQEAYELGQKNDYLEFSKLKDKNSNSVIALSNAYIMGQNSIIYDKLINGIDHLLP